MRLLQEREVKQKSDFQKQEIDRKVKEMLAFEQKTTAEHAIFKETLLKERESLQAEFNAAQSELLREKGLLLNECSALRHELKKGFSGLEGKQQNLTIYEASLAQKEKELAEREQAEVELKKSNLREIEALAKQSDKTVASLQELIYREKVIVERQEAFRVYYAEAREFLNRDKARWRAKIKEERAKYRK